MKDNSYSVMPVGTSRALSRSEQWAGTYDMELTAVRPAYYIWTALGIVLAAFALRMWDVGVPSLWADEIMTEYRAQAPLMQSLENILKTIDQTPFYFMALRLFPTGNELLLRLPSALLGIMGTSLIMFVTRRLYRNNAMALWAGAWLAFNPYHIFLSRNARHYSLIFFLSLLVSYLFLSLWQGRTSPRRWLVFGVVSLIAYITHYSLLALPFVQMICLALAWRKRITFIWRWVLVQAVAVIPMVVWFALVLLNLSPREPQWGAPPWVGDLVLTFRNMTAGYDGALHWYTLPGLMVAVAGLALTAQGWRQQEDTIAQNNFYWLLLVTVPFFLVFALSVTAVDMYMDRYFMALLPGLIFLIAYGWTLARRWWWRIAALAVMVTGATTTGLAYVDQTNRREDWRGAASYVEDEYQPDDVFVVDRAVTMTSFTRYFETANPLHVVQLSETDRAIPPDQPGGRYWVIYRNPFEDVHRLGVMPGFNPFSANRTVTSQWLIPRRKYVEEHRAFDGVTILRVDMPATLADDPVAGAQPQ
jgi:uncharacterized membrane protein